MRAAASLVAASAVAAVISAPSAHAGPASAASSDRLCLGAYGNAHARTGAPLRFGIDPGIGGSIGGTQSAAVPDNPARDLVALRALRPRGRTLVVRLNRLFFSDGQAGVDRFRRLAGGYTRAGFDVEIQVRYHPSPSQNGDLHSWARYVRHVVDSFGRDRRVVAMTITNEVNVKISPNTSDGYYERAPDALITGIEAAHNEALRRHFGQLRFGFTYAYRFVPAEDAALFAYLGAHGGVALRR